MQLIDALARTGLQRLEVTSFVRPDVIPQLADATQVLEQIDVPAGVSRSVLIPNERGLEQALAVRDRFDEINVFLSASETHNRKNVNRSIEESLTALERVLPQARDAGLRCEGVISVAFGCPYEGLIEPERVFAIARRLAQAGAEEIGFGDTTGMANPAQVSRFFATGAEQLAGVELTAHFHNTRGQGLANVYAALEAGVSLVRIEFRRARRVSRAARRNRQCRHRGRRLDAARDRDRDRGRPACADRVLARPAASPRT